MAATHTPEYLIGIDLGTTHTVVAYANMQKPLDTNNCAIFEVEQLVAAGKIAKRPLLPSFRYHPTVGELNPADLLLPWSNDSETLAAELPQVVIGEWARELGAKVDGRQVVSAKSWLSHPQVDRSADILPWAAAEGVEKVSPVQASASYLFHVRKSWNSEHPDALLEHQEVVITVPASFDEAARALTVESAERAGFGKILLLEEPQAVCYDWYARSKDNAQQYLQNIKLLLVCDVGGGTTDLSLIKVDEQPDKTLALTRIAVGNHLMLGGDNIDLALAHTAEQTINKGSNKKLSAASLSQLIQQTRKAKELLLSENAPQSAKVTVLGSGAKLIGGAKSCELQQSQVRKLALEGFFPLSSFTERPNKRRSAVVEFGLPYASDPAISKHLAEFIGEHQSACKEALGLSENDSQYAIPDALLLNGGVFNSPLITRRTQDLLKQWSGDSVCLLDNNHPDLAVAYGAVAYAKARRGAQLKIGGGSARSFFLVLEDKEQKTELVCLMPKGTEENIELTLPQRRFALRTGAPVKFHLYCTSNDKHYSPGELITLDHDALAAQNFISLPPLVAALETSDRDVSSHAEIEVALTSTLTEVGTLQIDCVADNQQRWHVAFQIRKDLATQSQQLSGGALPARFEQALSHIDDVFGSSKKKADTKTVKALRKNIEKTIGKREAWQVNTLREVFDQLLATQKNRRRSADHERHWFNLAGYGLRPGFGYPADEWRIEQIWPLYEQGLQFQKETQLWSTWWNFWSRAAGGLSADQQMRIYKDIAPYIDIEAKTSRKLSAAGKKKSYEDMVKLAAALEHIPAEDKIETALSLLERLEGSGESNASWWAIGRLASRIPFHGSAHNVIEKDEIETWLEPLLEIDFKANLQAAFAIVMMTRKSGDRSRDISEYWREQVIHKLTDAKVPASWIEMVATVKELDEQETKQVFGEALPTGLSLIQ
ncbi:MAG: hsp70 family protein [Pseudomonadales bacterium]|nr:hsp70 family protein [Pseudomonadales bacterium]